MKLFKMLLIVVLFSVSFLFAEKTIVLSLGEWAPYMSESADGYGLTSRVVTAAFKEVGYNVEYAWMPWKRAFESAKDGKKYAGSPGWPINEERQIDFLFSTEPLLVSKTVFFYRKDLDFQWSNYNDLKKYKFGHTRGYSYPGVFDDKLNLDIANSDILNFKKLIAGRVDAFDCEFNVGYSLLTSNFSDADRAKITNHPKALSEEGDYLILSKKYPNVEKIMEEFNKGLKIIKEKGIYKKIMGSL